jgi:hypothetical protein
VDEGRGAAGSRESWGRGLRSTRSRPGHRPIRVGVLAETGQDPFDRIPVHIGQHVERLRLGAGVESGPYLVEWRAGIVEHVEGPHGGGQLTEGLAAAHRQAGLGHRFVVPGSHPLDHGVGRAGLVGHHLDGQRGLDRPADAGDVGLGGP